MGEVNDEKCQMIERYFTEYGWTVNRGGEMGTWNIGIRSEVATHDLFVRVTEWWIYFVINPLVNGPKDPTMKARLHNHLLRLNLDISVAKYALNKDDDVVLSVELPCDSAATFQYGELEDAINLIFHNCNNYYVDILRIATDANAKSEYLDGASDVDLG